MQNEPDTSSSGSPPPEPPTQGWRAREDAARLRHTLVSELARIDAERRNSPALVVLCGLPGTGKSHFAARLARRIPAIILGSDRLRKSLVASPAYTRSEHIRVFQAIHYLLEELLIEGCLVIFDATNLTEQTRQPLYDIAQRTGAALTLVQCHAPPDLVRRRLAQRADGQASPSGSDADWRIYCRLLPGVEPVARRHFRVDSSRNINPVLDRVARLVSRQRA